MGLGGAEVEVFFEGGGKGLSGEEVISAGGVGDGEVAVVVCAGVVLYAGAIGWVGDRDAAGFDGDVAGGGSVGMEQYTVDGGPRMEEEGAGVGELFVGGEGVTVVVGGDEEEVGLLRGEGEGAVVAGGGVVRGAAFDEFGSEGVVGVVDVESAGGEEDGGVGERSAVGVHELGGEGRGFFEGKVMS